jgi:hypothetical protein
MLLYFKHMLLPRTTKTQKPLKYLTLFVLFICLSSTRQLKCLRVSKTESYGISRIGFEMTRQATMPSSSAEVSSRIQNRELRPELDGQDVELLIVLST